MARQKPMTLTASIWLLWALVVMSGVTALLMVVYRDEVETSWAYGNPAALEQFRQGGLEQLRASNVDIPDFGPVAITAFFTFALVALVLTAFLRGGHPWARWAITVMVLFAAFMSVLTLGRQVPTLFTVLAVVSLLLYVALLVCLWHPNCSRFFREPVPTQR